MLARHSKNLNDVASFILLYATILDRDYEIARLHFKSCSALRNMLEVTIHVHVSDSSCVDG